MTTKSLNIVFWGEDAFSNVVLLSLLREGHKVPLVVTPYYENSIYKKLEFTCKQNGIPLLRAKKINSDEVFEAVRLATPDLCVIAHFERLLKKPLLELPSMGFINLHPSLLPFYRGMAPQHWPIINGETETGITVHFVEERADTGNIIIQRQLAISPDMYVSDLQKQWLFHYETIIVEAIQHILQGKPTQEQRHLKGSYYGKLQEEQCIISPKMSIRQAYKRVRRVSWPYFGARYGNTVIYRAHIAKQGEDVTNKVTFEFSDGILVADMYKQNIQD